MSKSRLNQNIVAEVKIDGIAHDPARIWAHAQNDPYPGGHRFEVVCTGPDTTEYFKDFPREVPPQLEKSKANVFLQWLTWAFPMPKAVNQFDFVLNTIDKVVIDDREVRVFGECSRFLR